MIPKILYKYKTWGETHHDEILTKQWLYYASASQFNDELDCHPVLEDPTLDDIYYYSQKQNPTFSPEEHQEYIRMQWQNYYNGAEYRRKRQKEIDDRRYKMFGILCLTQRYNNEYLWWQYSKEHNGFCVEYDYEKLFNQLPIGGAGFVVYTETPPSINLFREKPEDMTNTFMRKISKYQREEEYRRIVVSNHILSTKERNISFSIDCIIKVYIDSLMNDSYKRKIYKIADNRFPIEELSITIKDENDEAIVEHINI